MASVDIRDVRKAFGPVQIIKGVSVPIADGEFVVLVGPSGCGKSTLLRMIAGLENITGGTISIGDRVVNNVHPKERDIAMVFQNYALYPHMTVGENMGFSLKLRNTDKAIIAERVAKAAGILGLDKLLDRYPRQLSGGQRQRVAMGRAIVRNPQVFLLEGSGVGRDQSQHAGGTIGTRQRSDENLALQLLGHDEGQLAAPLDPLAMQKLPRAGPGNQTLQPGLRNGCAADLRSQLAAGPRCRHGFQ